MKTIWITGGSTGIGAATAKQFNDNNWRVIISSRNTNKLNETCKLIKDNSSNKEIYAIECDITNIDIELEVSATGGIGNYNYLWSNGDTSRNIFNLPPSI